MKRPASSFYLVLAIVLANTLRCSSSTHDLTAEDEPQIINTGGNVSQCLSVAPSRFDAFLASLGAIDQTSDFTVLPFFLCATNPIDPEGITASTHLSLEPHRLQNIKTLVQSWRGPVSLSLVVRQPHTRGGKGEVNLDDIMKELRHLIDETPAAPQFYAQVDVHLIIEHRQLSERRYPYNLARNLAIVSARTRFLLIMDGDILIPASMNDYLPRFRPALRNHLGRLIIALVTFEIPEPKEGEPPTPPPANVADLRTLLAAKKAYRAKHYQQAPVNDSELWTTDDASTFPIAFRQRLEFNYLAMTGFDDDVTLPDLDLVSFSRSSGKIPRFPLYNTSFVGIGFDRTSHIWELFARKFDMHAARGAFLYSYRHEIIEKAKNSKYTKIDLAINRNKAVDNSVQLAERATKLANSTGSAAAVFHAAFTHLLTPGNRAPEALELFNRRLGMVAANGDDEDDKFEMYLSKLGNVLCMQMQDKGTPVSLKKLFAASDTIAEEYPERAETLAVSAFMARRHQDTAECYRRAKQANERVVRFGEPPEERLGIFPEAYDYTILRELCLCGSSTGEYGQALTACERLLSENRLHSVQQEPMVENLIKTLRAALEKREREERALGAEANKLP